LKTSTATIVENNWPLHAVQVFLSSQPKLDKRAYKGSPSRYQIITGRFSCNRTNFAFGIQSSRVQFCQQQPRLLVSKS